ncbi:hypothetical protein LUZ63_014287 [Rhynchospora breviuscula]|uniref:Uncharacterized protein n=1 Tax=Rhynchospora breviuscula TaxID=2022672 RepID=A0A9Q0HL06_9POAL|nr:hypothetical protein LUZ63_014287 [Rhynchospora breviuscula]
MGVEDDDVAADEVQKFMKKKLDEVSGEPFKPRSVTIFRLPAKFYENNEDLFEPKIVSIGPYHHDKESVKAMEENKWSTLRDFLARNKNVGFEVYLREMRLLEGQARQCYSETVNLKRVLPYNQLGGEQRDIESSSSCNRIPCVSKLTQAGVIFRRKRRPRDMFDISFQYGIMEIPYVQIDSTLKNYLWNMVVFEQSQRFKFDQILISYVALMSSLIYTEMDVAILGRSNIMPNYLKNDEQVATFFNQSSESYFGLNYTNHYFHGVFKAVNEYNEMNWNKYRAQLKREYFKDPWTSILVMQAAIILVLTVLQTYYSAAK